MKKHRIWFATMVLGLTGSSAFAAVDPQITEALKHVKASQYPSANAVSVISDQAVVYQPL